MSLSNHPVMLIDAHNLFIRGFIVSPRMSNIGESVGGYVTFLQTLGNLVEQHSPSHVHVVWEGGDGSPWRRGIYKDYKQGRRPKRFNRVENIEENTVADEYRQMHNLIKNYLPKLPLKQYVLPNLEADDIIYEIIRRLPKERKKIIVSTDRDFCQLISDEVSVFNPVKKVFMDGESLRDEFSATPQNLVLARCFLGDKSDAIPGIKGVGPKWLQKNLPFLLEDEPHNLDDVREAIQSADKQGTVHKRIMENFNDLRRNWKLMNLGTAPLGEKSRKRLEKTLMDEDSDWYKVDRFGVLKALINDSLDRTVLNDHWYKSMEALAFRGRSENLFGEEDEK